MMRTDVATVCSATQQCDRRTFWVPGLLGLRVSRLHKVLKSGDPDLGGVAVTETAVCGSG